jgi:hypothetical protein
MRAMTPLPRLFCYSGNAPTLLGMLVAGFFRPDHDPPVGSSPISSP